MERDWTVIMLYPDYMTEDYGADIYTAWAKHEDPFEATKLARKNAYDDQQPDNGDENPVNDPEDFRVIAVIEGAHALQLSAADF